MTNYAERLALENALDEFVVLMKKKLFEKVDDGCVGWDNPEIKNNLQAKLLIKATQLATGDQTQAEDVANYAMFLFYMKNQKINNECNCCKDNTVQ